MKNKILVFIFALLVTGMFTSATPVYAYTCPDGSVRDLPSQCPTAGPATSTGTTTTTNNPPASQPLDTISKDPNCNIDGQTTKICNPLGENTLMGLIMFVLNKIFALIGIVAVFVIVIAGFQMVAFASDPKQWEKAKGTLTNAIGGLALSALAYIIVAIVQNTLS
jgi:hypothetical protein